MKRGRKWFLSRPPPGGDVDLTDDARTRIASFAHLAHGSLTDNGDRTFT